MTSVASTVASTVDALYTLPWQKLGAVGFFCVVFCLASLWVMYLVIRAVLRFAENIVTSTKKDNSR